MNNYTGRKRSDIVRKNISDGVRNSKHSEIMKSDVVRKKISIGLNKFFSENGGAVSRGEKHSKAVGKYTKGRFNVNPKNIYELSNRTKTKIIKRLELSCCICNWNEDSVDIHHIIAKKDGGVNDHYNLTPLCPNHHRLAGNKKIPVEKLITLEQIVGDCWKDVYYG